MQLILWSRHFFSFQYRISVRAGKLLSASTNPTTYSFTPHARPVGELWTTRIEVSGIGRSLHRPSYGASSEARLRLHAIMSCKKLSFIRRYSQVACAFRRSSSTCLARSQFRILGQDIVPLASTIFSPASAYQYNMRLSSCSMLCCVWTLHLPPHRRICTTFFELFIEKRMEAICYINKNGASETGRNCCF